MSKHNALDSVTIGYNQGADGRDDDYYDDSDDSNPYDDVGAQLFTLCAVADFDQWNNDDASTDAGVAVGSLSLHSNQQGYVNSTYLPSGASSTIDDGWVEQAPRRGPGSEMHSMTASVNSALTGSSKSARSVTSGTTEPNRGSQAGGFGVNLLPSKSQPSGGIMPTGSASKPAPSAGRFAKVNAYVSVLLSTLAPSIFIRPLDELQCPWLTRSHRSPNLTQRWTRTKKTAMKSGKRRDRLPPCTEILMMTLKALMTSTPSDL